MKPLLTSILLCTILAACTPTPDLIFICPPMPHITMIDRMALANAMQNKPDPVRDPFIRKMIPVLMNGNICGITFQDK